MPLGSRLALGATVLTLPFAGSAQAKPTLLPTPTGARAGERISLELKGLEGKPRFSLSADAERGRTDRALRARRSKGRWQVRLPKSLPFGPRFVIACARGRCASTPVAVIARARPLRVEPQLDESFTASTGSIGPEGGSLFAFGSDGTSYELAIPEGALVDPIEITMTPLASIERAPLSGGFSGGVDLKPSGLHLARPGMLRIQPPGEIPRAGGAAASYSGSGGDFHFVPFNEDALSIPVVHFSGYASGTATAADRRRASEHPPSKAAQQAWAAAAEAQRRARSMADLQKATRPVFDTLFYADVLPRLELAEDDDPLVLPAIRSAIEWVVAVNMVFGSGSGSLFDGNEFGLERDYLEAQVPHLLGVAQRRSLILCGKDKDPAQIARYVAWTKALALFEGQTANLDDMGSELAPCARYEIDVIADFTDMEIGTSTNGGRQLLNVRGSVAGLQLKAPKSSQLFFEGSTGEVQPTLHPSSYRHPGCAVNGTAVEPGAIKFRAEIRAGAELDYDNQKIGDAHGSVTLGPGNPVEVVRYTCPGDDTQSEERAQAWASHWPIASHLNSSGDSIGPQSQPLHVFPASFAPGGQAFSRTWISKPEANPESNPDFEGTIAVDVRHTPDASLAARPSRKRTGKGRDAHQQRILRMLRVYAERRRKAAGP